MTSKTGCNSPGELEMTWSTSERCAGCSLERFAQLAEQPRILDGDDSLRGEVLNKLDLLIRKWANFLAEKSEQTDQFVVLQHRDFQKCPYAANFDCAAIAGLRCSM